MKILVINNNAKQCGVHQYGITFTDFLKTNKDWEVLYSEVEKKQTITEEVVERERPDLVLVNYFMQWWMECAPAVLLAKSYGIKCGAILHDPLPPDIFDFVLYSDAEKEKPVGKIHYYPRVVARNPYRGCEQHERFTIGTLGLGAIQGKEDMWTNCLSAIAREFTNIDVRFHTPIATFRNMSLSMIEKTNDMLVGYGERLGLNVIINTEYMQREEFIHEISMNHLNLFLYGQPAGPIPKSGSAEYGISSCRPMVINKSMMLSYLRPYLKTYPDITLKESLETSQPIIEELYDRWGPEAFVESMKKTFERI